MRITIFGSGYVGLVTGACFANVGNQVICVDIDQSKVDALSKGVIPIYEPGLEDIIKNCLAEGSSKIYHRCRHGCRAWGYDLYCRRYATGRRRFC